MTVWTIMSLIQSMAFSVWCNDFFFSYYTWKHWIIKNAIKIFDIDVDAFISEDAHT